MFTVTSVVGLNTRRALVDGSGTTARLSTPYHMSFNAAGALYVAESTRAVIRILSPAGVLTTWTTIVAPSSFPYAVGLAVHPNGHLYFSESSLFGSGVFVTSVAKVTTPFAGREDLDGYAEGQGTGALFLYPLGLRDSVIDIVFDSAAVDLLVGTWDNGDAGVTLDTSGNLLVCDTGNSRLRRVTPGGLVSTFASISVNR